MPTNLAVNFINSIANFTAGNQGIVNELTNVINLDLDTVLGQQMNPAASVFMQSVFSYYSELINSFNTIANFVEKKVAHFNDQSIESSMYSIRIDDMVNSIFSITTMVADTFQQISATSSGFQSDITSQPIPYCMSCEKRPKM